ncbi:MAG TPA: HAD family phosphatase [Pseudonocardia sp.]|jgi:HAD superfamily hydrolase (TIGR01509 family)
MSGPRAVLWDMDGTLVDSEKLWDVSLADLARHLGGELGTHTREAMVGSSLWRTIDMMFAEFGLPGGPQARVEAGEWLTGRTEELFRAGLPWRPGAPEALRTVRDEGLATALVTSTHRRLVEVALDSVGREYFDVVVCGDEVPATKPAPDPYRIAAGKLGLAPGDCVAVEDSPTGAESAAAAGCVVLVVPSEVPVAGGPRRVHRADLLGLTAAELGTAWRAGGAEDH